MHVQWACTPYQAHLAQALNMAVMLSSELTSAWQSHGLGLHNIMGFSILWVPHVLNYGSLFYNVVCFCFVDDLVMFRISGNCVSGW